MHRNFLIIALYNYSYLLTYLLTLITSFRRQRGFVFDRLCYLLRRLYYWENPLEKPAKQPPETLGLTLTLILTITLTLTLVFSGKGFLKGFPEGYIREPTFVAIAVVRENVCSS